MSDLMLRLGALVDELKRRGVLRVGAVDRVGAWLVIQVAAGAMAVARTVG